MAFHLHLGSLINGFLKQQWRRIHMWHKQMTVFLYYWTEIDLFKINIISSLMYDLQTRTIIDKTYYNYFYWTVTIFFHHDYQKEKKQNQK